MAEKAEDLNLPLSVVTRIIKDALPDGVNVSREARVAIARAASVFVLYATATANSYAVKAKRKTLAASDVVEAMKDMEFEELVEPLMDALESWKQSVKAKKAKAGSSTKPKPAAEASKSAENGENADVEDIDEDIAVDKNDPDLVILDSDDSDSVSVKVTTK